MWKHFSSDELWTEEKHICVCVGGVFKFKVSIELAKTYLVHPPVIMHHKLICGHVFHIVQGGQAWPIGLCPDRFLFVSLTNLPCASELPYQLQLAPSSGRWVNTFWSQLTSLYLSSYTRLFPEILLAWPRPWVAARTNEQNAWRILWPCFCPAFHLDNKNPSVLKGGQATHRYVRQGNVVHLLIFCKFTLNHAWSFNKAHLSLYQEREKHQTEILKQ